MSVTRDSTLLRDSAVMSVPEREVYINVRVYWTLLKDLRSGGKRQWGLEGVSLSGEIS